MLQESTEDASQSSPTTLLHINPHRHNTKHILGSKNVGG